jgi:hypothetical protein
MINIQKDRIPAHLQPGDIFLTQGTGLVSRLIRFFSRSGGESRTKVNHVGLVVWTKEIPHCEDEIMIVEARSKVQRNNMICVYNDADTRIAVYRPINLTQDELKKIVAKAQSYVGNSYGYGKIAAHFGDWLLGGRYFFRRFASMDKYPICSWLVAAAYAEADKNFGCPVGMASPDDIWDFVNANPDKYEVVWQL